jgi:hypothetical protein
MMMTHVGMHLYLVRKSWFSESLELFMVHSLKFKDIALTSCAIPHKIVAFASDAQFWQFHEPVRIFLHQRDASLVQIFFPVSVSAMTIVENTLCPGRVRRLLFEPKKLKEQTSIALMRETRRMEPT